MASPALRPKLAEVVTLAERQWLRDLAAAGHPRIASRLADTFGVNMREVE